MKEFIICLMLLFISTVTFCQQTDSKKILTPEDYLKKSKNQKTAAWILAGGGGALVITGVLLSGKNENSFDDAATQTILIGAGVLSAIGSIPLFVASAKNKKRGMAASACLIMEDAPGIRKYCMTYSTFPAVSIKFKFRNL